MAEIGVGIVGGGYMGKAHAVAMRAVGAVFDLALEPRLEMVAARSQESAERYRQAYGFARAASDWRRLVADDKVEAVVIASHQDTHRAIAEAALAAGKPVLCEKPLGASLDDSRAMAMAARRSGVVNMVGFNYFQTPATQYAHQLLDAGEIGRLVWFRGEHTEDFLADPEISASRLTRDRATGTMGDLSPHMIQAALGLMGPVRSLAAEVETVHRERPGDGGREAVTNDDQAQIMCRFANGAMGHLFFSRVATGRKMGYAYEIVGDKGAIRFDQEDQNALWLYRVDDPNAERGFRKILAGPDHPNYRPFCQGPGHGTGYQDQIIIEAAQFLRAIAKGRPASPDFGVGYEVHRIVSAAEESSRRRAWIELDTSGSDDATEEGQ